VTLHRILVVEDEAIVAMDIESRLAGMGYSLAGRAVSGEQALALAETERPDLVLMDIRLQGEMDGIEAAREIHQRFRIPVIFLTAYSEETTLERAKLAEPFGYILKPFDDRELKSAIEIALYKHRTEEELHRMNRLYAVLSHVNEAIIHIQSREELFKSVCRVVVGYGELDLAWIGWLEPESRRIKPVAWFGKRSEMLSQVDFYAEALPERQGNPGRAIREGETFVCNACGTEECPYPKGKAPSRFGFQSCASFPLWFQGEALGVLSLCVSGPDFFEAPETDLLGEVAADVSFALDKIEGDRLRRQAEKEKELTAEVLGLINSAADTRALLKAVLSCLKRWADCEAVGIRLRDGEDFPYFETSGFPESFVRMENSLCKRDTQGEIVRDSEGNPLLECMCGNILQGRIDSSKPFFSNFGSFWSNCTTELLAASTEADRQARTRNRCNGEGYESVALIPLRSRGQTVGLIQLNDKRTGQFSPEKIALFERLGEHIANFLARMQLEERLKESEAKLRAIGDNLPEGYVYQYAHGKDQSPKFLYVSAGVRQIHNVSPEEVLRDADALLGQLDPGQTRIYMEAERQSAAELSDFVMDLHMRRPDGDWCWLHASSRPHLQPDGQVVWDGVAIDITARREAEAQLRKLSAAVEQTPAVVVITDPQAKIEYVNPAFTRITGYTFEEVRGKNPDILKSGETPVEVYRDLWQTITAGREWRGILHNRRKDRTLFWERVVISAIRDPAGKTTSYVAVKEDITEQKALEDQLHQAQKMESVGRLAGGVAHDFNNMLMVISGYTDLILMQTESDDPRYPGLQEIRNAARRSANLTRQLLAFARKQTVSPVVLDMNETIEGMLKMLRRLIGEDIELAWLPGTGLWKVRIDPSQIDQLLANLAVNARDAIAGVGTVTIKTENLVLDALSCAHHQGCVPGEHVVLVVSDTGIGMGQEVLAHIFEPFFTTKEEGKGTGLGLATVYGIVKQNLGFVSVDSEPGRGTTFRIHLPRFVEQTKGDLVAQDLDESLPGGKETVLLVEDEEAILNLGRQFIERLGYTVLAANSPAEALRQVEGFGGVIHLLITDIVMPQMNGKDLAERLRQRFPGLKCLFMSGYSADIIAKQGVLEEGIHFLQKPFALRDIAFKARQALDE
jgi:PAS domain S-box-containing protein